MKVELLPLGDWERTPLRLEKIITLIGRDPECDLVIPDVSLSWHHCIFVQTDGLLWFRDLLSTNGIKVNGTRARWGAIMPNDRITLGRFRARVYLGPDHLPSPLDRLGSRAL